MLQRPPNGGANTARVTDPIQESVLKFLEKMFFEGRAGPRRPTTGFDLADYCFKTFKVVIIALSAFLMANKELNIQFNIAVSCLFALHLVVGDRLD